MSKHDDDVRAQLAAAKASLGVTAAARSARGKRVKEATSTRRLRATGRDVTWSVRCRGDLPDAIKRHCDQQGISIAAWFEQLMDRELGETS